MGEPKQKPALLRQSGAARDLGIDRDTFKKMADVGAIPPTIKTPQGDWWARADLERVKAGVLAKEVTE